MMKVEMKGGQLPLVPIKHSHNSRIHCNNAVLECSVKFLCGPAAK